MEPVLSVIVAAYNEERYIRKCISSILANDIEEMEVIIVDDGSTDNTYAVCYEIAKEESKVILLHQENAGVSVARNAGLRIARGEYFAFVDADDYVDENMYTIMLRELKESGADVAYCGMTWERENDSKVECNKTAYGVKIIEDKEKILRILFGGKNTQGTSTANKVARRGIQVEKTIYFHERLKSWEDGLFWCKFFVHVNSATVLDIPLYHVVVNDDNVTRNYYDMEGKLSGIEAWHTMISICEEVSPSIGILVKAKYHWWLERVLFRLYMTRGKKETKIMHELNMYRMQFVFSTVISCGVKVFYLIAECIVRCDLGTKWAMRWKKVRDIIRKNDL